MTEMLEAKKVDIGSIEIVYENIHNDEEKELTTTGWIRNVYPTVETAQNALNRGDLFVMKVDNETVATAIINQIQIDEYKNSIWRLDSKNNEVMVLHCLAVDPQRKSKGYGQVS